jgi:hypothetical protein
MAGGGLIAGLSIAIVLLLFFRALWVVRQEKDQGRGSLPGQGDHEVRADYFSGGAGGGHSGSFRVPKDPQTYAQQFVPKDRKPKDER